MLVGEKVSDMVNAIIVDDEEVCRSTLRSVINRSFKEINLLRECTSAHEALEAIIQLKPDLVFLDVEMPGKSGLDLLKDLKEISFEIIFTTAHAQYAINAIKASALDFLLKPVGRDDLQEALERYKTRKASHDVNKQIEVLVQHYRNSREKMLVIPTLAGLEFIKIDDIVRLQSDVNYTIFHLVNSKFIASKTLKTFEEILVPLGFFRIHQSHLVNMMHIKRFSKGDSTLMMADDSIVDVARQRKEEFLKAITQKHP